MPIENYESRYDLPQDEQHPATRHLPLDDEERDKASHGGDFSLCCPSSVHGFHCTRPPGHTGKHVAHGGQDWVCATWTGIEEKS